MRDYNQYSITAYRIIFSERKKGSKGIPLAELDDYSSFLKDPINIYNLFASNNINNNSEVENRFFIIKNTYEETKNFIKIISLNIDYGSESGIKFSVLNSSGSSNFSKESKIIKPYRVYFYLFKEKMYFIAFRNGKYSCKTAVMKEFERVLKSSNIKVEFDPTSNERYIERHFGNADISSIQFETLFLNDSGDLSNNSDKKTEVNSCVTINMTSPKNKKNYKIGSFKDFLLGTTRDTIISRVKKTCINSEEIGIDEDSLKVEIVLNKRKRIISFDALTSLLYDIDITDKILKDKNDEIVFSSVDNIVYEYMKDIIENDN